MSIKAGLRERKKLQTRRRIHTAAVELASRQGLDCVTIEEIAAAAEVSPRTFFNYFPGKDQAVIGSDPELPEQLATAIGGYPADVTPLDCLERAFVEHALPRVSGGGLKARRWEVIQANPRLLPSTLGVGRELERRCAEALASRLGRPVDDALPHLIAAAGAAAVRVALEVSRRESRDVCEVAAECFATMRAGFATS